MILSSLLKRKKVKRVGWKFPRNKIEEKIYPAFVEVFELGPDDYEKATDIMEQAIDDVYAEVYSETVEETALGYRLKKLKLGTVSIGKKIGEILKWSCIILLTIPVGIVFLLTVIFSRSFRKKLASQD